MMPTGRAEPGNDTISEGPITFLSKTYDEAYALLVETRDYMQVVGQSSRRGASFDLRLAISRESMRLTARLVQVMAWLLAQKAVQAGEINLATAAERLGLGGHEVCLVHDEAAVETLPAPLRSLMERSYRLYVRVSRLDEMVQRDSMGGQISNPQGAGTPPSPVR